MTSRRYMLTFVGSTLLSAGCVKDNSDETTSGPIGHLKLGATSFKQDGEWYIEVFVYHATDNASSFHNTTVHGYSDTGEQVCSIAFGDSPRHSGIDATKTSQCVAFPFLLVVTAKESPCADGLKFDILRWNGSTDQREQKTDETTVTYEVFQRECNDDLPPERLLPEETEKTA